MSQQETSEREGLSDSDSTAASHGESSRSSESEEEKEAVITQGMNPVTARAQPVNQERNVFPYPPGFKQIQEKVGRFTGKCGDEDFEVWLADFHEATADCKWTDKQRAQWFSWFLSGAAKSTWQ